MRCLSVGLVLVLLASIAQAQPTGSNRMSFYRRSVVANPVQTRTATSNGMQASPVARRQPARGSVVSKQFMAPLLGNVSQSSTGQESFQRPPLVLEMLPIQTPKKANPMVIGTVNADLIKKYVEGQTSKNGGAVKNQGATGGQGSVMTPVIPLPPPKSPIFPNVHPAGKLPNIVVVPGAVFPLPNQLPAASKATAPIIASTLPKLPKNTALVSNAAALSKLGDGIGSRQMRVTGGDEPAENTDVGDTYNYLEDKGNDAQTAALNQILAALEKDLRDIAKKTLTAAEQAAFDKAIEEAKKGNTKPLEDLLKTLQGKGLTDGMDAFLKTIKLLGDVAKPGPLDAKQLKELEDLLNTASNLAGVKNATGDSMAQLKLWNEILNELEKMPKDGATPDGNLSQLMYWVEYLAMLLAYGGGAGGVGGDAIGGGYPADGLYGDPSATAGGGVMVPSNAMDGIAPAAAGSPVILLNPKANQSPVSYVLVDAFPCEMKAGEKQELPARASGPWTIAFDRGNGSEPARYTLAEGTYEFKLTQNGWDLVPKEYEVTIANALPVDFNYLVDGQQATLMAGQQQKHTSGAPLEVIFDCGDGGQPATLRLEGGVYKVSVDEAKQRLDLVADKLAQAGN